MEGKLVIVTLIILFALVIFASVDAWKVELGRLLRRGWDCFDIKAQEDAGDFIDSAAPSPVQSRYRPTFHNNNNNGSRTPKITGDIIKHENQTSIRVTLMGKAKLAIMITFMALTMVVTTTLM